ncbi:MAG: hypothetical protein L0H64_22755 [Pseudonocardia sp.]|nr:hypothetical protein [Pseudonocardia sp.]
MFTVFCPRHGTRVLLSERRVRAVHNTADGIVVEIECHDGARILTVTGRALDGSAADRATSARRAIAAVRRAPHTVPPDVGHASVS